MVSPASATLRQNIISNNISTAAVSNAFAGAEASNFLPRGSFAWTPYRDRKITIHGGIGMYEDAMNVGGVIAGLTTNSPSYLNLSFGYFNAAPLNIVDPRNFYGTDWTAAAPFGNTYSFPSITPAGVDSHGEVLLNENGTPTPLTSALSGVDPHLAPQKTTLYNLQMETELPYNVIFGVGYAGSFSWNQYANGDYNSFPGDKIVNNGNLKRLSGEWAGVSISKGLLSSNYNALLLTIRQNYHRLSWQAAYSWSQTLGYGGSSSSSGVVSPIADIYDPHHYYGPQAGAVPNSLTAYASYELPGRDLHKFVERAVLGGWTLSSVVSAQAGTPFSLITTAAFVPIANALPSQGGTCVPKAPATTCGTDISNPTNAGEYLANGFTNNLVNVPDGMKRKGFNRTEWRNGIFSSVGYTSKSVPSFSNAATQGAAFTNPTAYGVSATYSSQGFNSFYGPGYLSLDGGLHKKVYLPWFGKEGQSILTMGVEGSNIINRANLKGPASNDLNTVSSFGLGVSQSANQARIIQLMAKFQF